MGEDGVGGVGLRERIRSHVLICFLALVIIRVAENRTSETWRTIRAETGQIRQGHFRSPDGDFAQTTELTQRQQDLLRALEVPDPRVSGASRPPDPPLSA